MKCKNRFLRLIGYLLAAAIACMFAPRAAQALAETEADRLVNSSDGQAASAGGGRSSQVVPQADSSHFNDVWAYWIDTGNWEQIFPQGTWPPTTRNHSAAYDPINKRMIMCGGETNTDIWSLSLTPGSETWALDGPTTGYFPGNMYGVDIVYCDGIKSLVACKTNSEPHRVFIWNVETNISREVYTPDAPPARQFPALAVDEASTRVLLYGGGSGGTTVYSDLWELDLRPGLENWRAIPQTGELPPPKWLLRAAIDTNRKRFILFGGNSYPNFASGDYRDTTYELDIAATTPTWTLAHPVQPPSARGQYTTVYDAATQRQYLFGGLFRVGAATQNILTYNEMWTYDPGTSSWFQQMPAGAVPEIRRMATAVLDTANHRIIVFGGQRILYIASQVKAMVKHPLNGHKISGNRVSIMAELTLGSPDLTRDVRFQYRQPSVTGPWIDIIPAGNNHPNPDATSPYFVHWDVTGLPNGLVDLRAVAMDINGNPDTAPDETVVTIDHEHPDTAQSLNAQGHVQLDYVIDQRAVHDISAADDSSSTYTNSINGNVRLRIIEGTFTTGTLLTATFANLAEYPEFDAGGKAIGILVDLAVESGQSIFPDGLPVRVIIQYPDDDQNGLVDHTNIHESTLSIVTKNSLGQIETLENNFVDVYENTVSADARHFSLFAVQGTPNSRIEDWTLLK